MITGRLKSQPEFINLEKSKLRKSEETLINSLRQGSSESLKTFYIPIKEQLRLLIEIDSLNEFYKNLYYDFPEDSLSIKQKKCIVRDFNQKIRFKNRKEKNDKGKKKKRNRWLSTI